MERIVRREQKSQTQPRVDRALNVLNFAFEWFARHVYMDYAQAHLKSDLSELPADAVGWLRVWQEQHDKEDTPRQPKGFEGWGVALLLEEAVKFVRKVQRAVEPVRDLLPADLVNAADNLNETFAGHGDLFIDMVFDKSPRRPGDDWLCLVIVSNARGFGEVLRRYIDPPSN